MRIGHFLTAALLALMSSLPLAQSTAPAPLSLITAQGRRPFPTATVNRLEMVATDDLVALLQVAVRDDPGAGGLTVSYKGRSLVVSPDQPVASVGGRLIPIASPAVRRGQRWLVPLDLIPRALPQIYDTRIELRQSSRLLIVGALRVPRVTVRLDSPGPPTRLSIEASPATRITPTVESGRVVLRLDADTLDVAPLPPSNGLLELARTEGNTVVLQLLPGAGQARSSLAAGENFSRVNIEIPAGVQVDGGGPPAPGAPVVPVVPPATTEPTPPALSFATRTIVLDPGHGGADGGVTGPDGVQEKTLTLALAQRMKTLLESRLAVRVLLTRDDDRDLAVDARASLANTNKADLFLSLHLNAALSPMVTGAEVYQWKAPPTTAPRDDAGRALVLPLPGGGTRTISLVPWHEAQERHRSNSTLLANLLESSLRAHVPMSERPLQDAPLRVLAGLDAPAVVVELAYLSNPEQATAAQADLFQSRAAQAVLEAITAYRAAQGRP